MQVTKNAAYLFSARLFNAASIMAVTLIISRSLGPNIFGGYSFLSAVIMTGTVLANFGLDTLMVREVSRHTSSGQEFLTSVLSFKILSSIVVMVVIYGLFRLFLNDAAMMRLLALFSTVICLNAIAQSLWYYGDAYQKFQSHAFLWAISNVMKVPVVWAFVSIKKDLSVVIYALIIAEVISLCISVCWVRSRFCLVFRNLSLRKISPLFGKVWPIAVIFIFSAFYFRIDLIMLELMKGEEAVGIYAAGYKMIEFLSIIPGTVTIAALPGLSVDYSERKDGFRAGFLKGVTVMVIGGASVGLFLFLFSEQIIQLLYGSLFDASSVSLRILAGAVCFQFVNGYLVYAFIATNNDRGVSLILVISTALNIFLNLLFIPRFSHVGAALSTLLSELFMSFLYVVLIAKMNPFMEQRLRTNHLT